MIKKIIFLFSIFILVFSFFYFKNFDKFSKKSSKDINTTLDYFEKNRIDKLEIIFGKKTFRHFLIMSQLIEQAEIQKYNTLNVWKEVEIEFNEQTFDAKMKVHGKNPNGHSNGFIYQSYSLKLKKGSSINGFRKFKIIISKRLEGSKKILALSKVTEVLSLPVHPVKVIFNKKYISEYVFIPSINNFFAEKNGKSTLYFFKEYEEKNVYKENDLKSFLFNSRKVSFENNQKHLKFLNNELSITLDKNHKFDNELKKQILIRFKNLNKVLSENNYSELTEYFEDDYIVRYLLTLIISAENGHQNVSANQQIAYDTATGYFYPFINWDSQTEIEKYLNSSDVLNSIQYYSEDIQIPLIKNLISNSEIRQKLLFRLKEFIAKLSNKNFIDQNLLKDINEKNYIQYLNEQLDLENITKINSIKTDYEYNFRNNKEINKLGKFDQNKFIFDTGKHIVKKNLIFPKNIDVEINKNTEIILSPNISVIIYSSLYMNGTPQNKIYIKSINNEKSFGSFVAIGGADHEVQISNLKINKPSETRINGKYLSGGLSLYNFNNINIQNLEIENSQGEDALNIKYAKNCDLENIFIKNSKFDAIDIDSCKTTGKNIYIQNSNLSDKNGDGIDFYYTNAYLENIEVSGFKDKGLSVGENSSVSLSNSLIYNNSIGSAVKDDSCLFILDKNKFQGNDIDISIYNKKKNYGSGNLIFSKKIQDLVIKKDKYAKIFINDNNFQC